MLMAGQYKGRDFGIDNQSRSEAVLSHVNSLGQAQARCVAPNRVGQSSANYRKAQALYDLDLHVERSVSGMRPDVGDTRLGAKNPRLSIHKNCYRINDLYDSGGLQ